MPRLASEIDVANVRDAADILDGGMTPRALMKALGFDAAALETFDPGQPRVPAGSGQMVRVRRRGLSRGGALRGMGCWADRFLRDPRQTPDRHGARVNVLSESIVWGGIDAIG